MLVFFDKMLVSRRGRALALDWANYAIRHYGHGAVGRLEMGLERSQADVPRRVLRLAIHIARERAASCIHVPTLAATRNAAS